SAMARCATAGACGPEPPSDSATRLTARAYGCGHLYISATPTREAGSLSPASKPTGDACDPPRRATRGSGHGGGVDANSGDARPSTAVVLGDVWRILANRTELVGSLNERTVLSRVKMARLRELTGEHVQARVRPEVEHAVQVELVCPCLRAPRLVH